MGVMGFFWKEESFGGLPLACEIGEAPSSSYGKPLPNAPGVAQHIPTACCGWLCDASSFASQVWVLPFATATDSWNDERSAKHVGHDFPEANYTQHFALVHLWLDS